MIEAKKWKDLKVKYAPHYAAALCQQMGMTRIKVSEVDIGMTHIEAKVSYLDLRGDPKKTSVRFSNTDLCIEIKKQMNKSKPQA